MKSKNISFHLFPPEGPGGPSTEGVGPSVTGVPGVITHNL